MRRKRSRRRIDRKTVLGLVDHGGKIVGWGSRIVTIGATARNEKEVSQGMGKILPNDAIENKA